MMGGRAIVEVRPVATSPGLTELTKIPRSDTLVANSRANNTTASFDCPNYLSLPFWQGGRGYHIVGDRIVGH